MFHQTFQSFDLVVVGLLVVLEGVLSIDNALVLGLLARRLPHRLQSKALTFGLVGALIFRLFAIALAVKLLQWRFIKLLGGGYLIFVAIKDLFFKSSSKAVSGHVPITPKAAAENALVEEQGEQEFIEQTHGVGFDHSQGDTTMGKDFWYAVAAIELTDIAFAADSILAAIALVGPPPPGTPPGTLHPKLWVIATGGMLGVVLMRVAAVIFIRLLEKFPRFEISAYLLVMIVGLKLIADYFFNAHEERLNFQSPSSPAFWVFWLLMVLCFAVGFIPKKSQRASGAPVNT